jgi:hypothetical protein
MSWGWITNDWRLKLLALGLSMLLLGAVAFSQNPATQKTITKPIVYQVPDGLIIINPQKTVQARVTGLADVVSTLTDASVSAEVDVTKATPGPAVKLNIAITSLTPGVTVLNPVVPIALYIDRRETVPLTVQVNTPNPVPGWAVTKAAAACVIPPQTITPCVVHYDGPKSWEAGLKAIATFPSPPDSATGTVPGIPIVLLQGNNTPLPETTTCCPPAGLDVSTVTIEVDAITGQSSTTVPLVAANPKNPPPSNYRVVGVTVNPVTVVISGEKTVIDKIQMITLPPIDLSNQTGTVTFRVPILYSAGVTFTTTIATITYTIQPNPQVSPSP